MTRERARRRPAQILGAFLKGPSIQVLTVRGLGSALQFGFNVLLGQVIGAAGSGSYYLLTSYVRAFGVIGNLGLPMATLRDLSTLRALRAHDASAHLYRRNVRLATWASVGLASLLLATAPWLATNVLGDPGVTTVLRLGGVGAVLFTLRRIQAEALKAYGRQNLAVALEGAIQTLAVGLVLVVGFALGRASVMLVLWGFLAVNAGLLAWGARAWTAAMTAAWSLDGGGDVRPGGTATTTRRLRLLLPFWGYAVVTVLATELPFFVLPRVADAVEIGLFGVAFRLVTLATTILAALAAVFGPRFAAAYARSDGRALRRELIRSQGISLLVYGPIAVLLFSAPRLVLRIFGAEFTGAAGILIILTAGQLIDAATGLCGYVLTMAGRESLAFWLNAASLALLVVLTLTLGRRFGASGVAFAYAIVLALRSLSSYALAWQRSGALLDRP